MARVCADIVEPAFVLPWAEPGIGGIAIHAELPADRGGDTAPNAEVEGRQG